MVMSMCIQFIYGFKAPNEKKKEWEVKYIDSFEDEDLENEIKNIHENLKITFSGDNKTEDLYLGLLIKTNGIDEYSIISFDENIEIDFNNYTKQQELFKKELEPKIEEIQKFIKTEEKPKIHTVFLRS